MSRWRRATAQEHLPRCITFNQFFICNECNRLLGNYPFHEDRGPILMLDLIDWVEHSKNHGIRSSTWTSDYREIAVTSKGMWERRMK